MKLLYIFPYGTEQQELFNTLVNSFKKNSLLLIQDGVYLGLYNSNCFNINSIFALEYDVIARGLQSCYPKNIKLINYDEFVELIIKYDKNITC